MDKIGKKILHRIDIIMGVQELAQEIAYDYDNADVAPINCMVVLNGAFFFGSNLITELYRYIDNTRNDIRIFFVNVSTYKGTKSILDTRPTLLFSKKPSYFENAHMLIIDDILDTGKTLKMLKQMFVACKCLTLKTVCLLNKQKCDFMLDYTGFIIDDIFVVGYGMDYNDKYRHLPYIAKLKKEN